MTESTTIQTSDSATVFDAAVMTRSISAVERAASAFDAIGSSVAALAREHPPAMMVDMNTKDGAKAAQAGYSAWRAKRLDLERCRKDVKAPLLHLTRTIDAYAGKLESSLRDGEGHYKKMIDDHAAEIERKERERVECHRANIAKIKSYAEAAVGVPPSRLRNGIDRLKAMTFGEEWQEFANDAHIARQRAVEAIEAMLEKALIDERIARERAEQDAALAKARDALAKERDALAAELRALESAKALTDFLKINRSLVSNAHCQSVSSAAVISDIKRLTSNGVPGAIAGDERMLAEESLAATISALKAVYDLLIVQERERAGVPAMTDPDSDKCDAVSEDPVPVAEADTLGDVVDDGGPGESDDSEKLINLTELSEWLGFTVSGFFVQHKLKIPVRKTQRKSTYFYDSDRLGIATALIEYLGTLRSAL